jgi:hypothetical protein
MERKGKIATVVPIKREGAPLKCKQNKQTKRPARRKQKETKWGKKITVSCAAAVKI